jgi:hypothetical protein
MLVVWNANMNMWDFISTSNAGIVVYRYVKKGNYKVFTMAIGVQKTDTECSALNS